MDDSSGIHYGFVCRFTPNVDHKNFPSCSVQDGLKKAQNVYFENNKLVVTKGYDRWINVDLCDDKKNTLNLNLLIKSINYLLEKKAKDFLNNINIIEIQIPAISSNSIHHYSTLLLSRYIIVNFFNQLNGIKNIYYIPADFSKVQDNYRLFVYQDVILKNDTIFYMPLILT